MRSVSCNCLVFGPAGLTMNSSCSGGKSCVAAAWLADVTAGDKSIRFNGMRKRASGADPGRMSSATATGPGATRLDRRKSRISVDGAGSAGAATRCGSHAPRKGTGLSPSCDPCRVVLGAHLSNHVLPPLPNDGDSVPGPVCVLDSAVSGRPPQSAVPRNEPRASRPDPRPAYGGSWANRCAVSGSGPRC
jgi:hypothetical protein